MSETQQKLLNRLYELLELRRQRELTELEDYSLRELLRWYNEN